MGLHSSTSRAVEPSTTATSIEVVIDTEAAAIGIVQLGLLLDNHHHTEGVVNSQCECFDTEVVPTIAEACSGQS